MTFFKPDDFDSAIIHNARDLKDKLMHGLVRHLAADLSNAKLDREGTIVYINANEEFVVYKEPNKVTTDKALLICIEKIEECKHLSNQISPLNFSFESNSGFSLICKCGARVTPTAFEEIKEK